MSDFSNKQKILPMAQTQNQTASSIRDIMPTYWFSAMQPVKVNTPTGYKPRQYNFQPGANLIWQPKGDSPITFAQLRELADGWDILRLMIEQRKDELCSVKWEIRAKQKPGESNADQKQRNAGDKTVQNLTDFFKKPDGFHDFPAWARLWLEDMIVIDAVALWLSRDGQGKINQIHPIAGDTINRMITDMGMTPADGKSIAYQQVSYGIPVWDFTTDDMIYFMSNERTNRRYGFSKVEQIVLTVNIGLRREMFQLNYYTDGTTPEAMVFLPSDLPIDRVEEIQNWFDTTLQGDLAARRKIRFLPGYGSGDQARPNVVFPKEVLLKDTMDEWLVQISAYCIGVSAQPFLKMMNRASAEEANDAAAQSGLAPDIMRMGSVLNSILDKMGLSDDYEFAPQDHREMDVLKQAQADNLVVGKIVTMNESREARGMDPRPEPEADMLGTFTPTGFLPLGEQANQDADQSEDEGQGQGDDDKPKNKQSSSSKGSSANDEDQAKARRGVKKGVKEKKTLVIGTRNTKIARSARAGVQKAVSSVLTSVKGQVIRNVKKNYPKSFTKVQKTGYDLDAIINVEWDQLPDDVKEHLALVSTEASTFGLAQIGVRSAGMISEANTVAGDWAQDRAAEMVGMKWDGDELIENPSARWALSDSTRTRLKEIVSGSFESNTAMSDLIDQIDTAGIFDDYRSEMIARTEVSLAQNQGNLLGWKTSGLVETVEWILSSEHDAESECDCEDNAENGPYDLNEVPDFPAHPNCLCNLQTVTIKEI
jgi:hypothetical protein